MGWIKDEESPLLELLAIPFVDIVEDECGGTAGDKLMGDKRGGLSPLLPLLPRSPYFFPLYFRVELLNLSIIYKMGTTTPINMTKRPKT